MHTHTQSVNGTVVLSKHWCQDAYLYMLNCNVQLGALVAELAVLEDGWVYVCLRLFVGVSRCVW